MEIDAETILNSWKATGIDNILEMGSSALPSFNPCQDIFSLPINENNDARGISDSVNVLSEVKEGFVKLMVVDED